MQENQLHLSLNKKNVYKIHFEFFSTLSQYL